MQYVEQYLPPPLDEIAKLSDEDVSQAADMLQCNEAAIRAVIAVESSGAGFLSSGYPKILFEAHHFSRFTHGKYDRRYPRISSPVWNRKLYVGGIREYERLDVALSLDVQAALKSASWGLFQIMGFNSALCECSSVEEFVNLMFVSEKTHLLAFCSFLKNRGLDEPLRELNWVVFARGYNGPSYAENEYHLKLSKEYARNLK